MVVIVVVTVSFEMKKYEHKKTPKMNVCRSMSYAVSWCKNVMQSESVTVNKQSSQMKTKKK